LTPSGLENEDDVEQANSIARDRLLSRSYGQKDMQNNISFVPYLIKQSLSVCADQRRPGDSGKLIRRVGVKIA
jgi:hypothetical protein